MRKVREKERWEKERREEEGVKIVNKYDIFGRCYFLKIFFLFEKK